MSQQQQQHQQQNQHICWSPYMLISKQSDTMCKEKFKFMNGTLFYTPTLLISLSLQPSDQRISLYLLFQLVFVFFHEKPLSCIWEKAFQICGHFVRAKKRSRVLRNLCMRVVWVHAWFRIWRFYRHQGRMFHTQVFVWMCVRNQLYATSMHVMILLWFYVFPVLATRLPDNPTKTQRHLLSRLW